MKRKNLSFLITLLQLMSCWAFATSWPFAFAPHDGAAAAHQQADQISTTHQATAFSSKQGLESMQGEAYRSLRALGSRPPNCEHKCGGCIPCYASQPPSTTDLVGLDQYPNYKPEGWKCKCGTSFFDP